MTEPSRELIGLLMLSLVPIFGLLAFRATRKLRKDQEVRIGTRPTNVANTAMESKQRPAFYVATTFEAEPLKRVWAFSLGARGRANVTIHQQGLVINRVGETDFLIDRESISRIESGSATIDRGTEPGGLVHIFWWLGETPLITTLRFSNLDDHRGFSSEAKEFISGNAS